MINENISQPPPKKKGVSTSSTSPKQKSRKSATKGIVYILINESMPNLVKIGTTKQDVEQRMSSLNSTSIPLPFECFYACTVDDCKSVEKAIHDAFKDSRVNKRREFFKISPSRVVSLLKLLAIKDVTPTKDVTNDKENTVGGSEENQKALNKARKQRPNFDFEIAEIPTGKTLTFLNKSDVTAKVHNKTEIEYKKKIISLSAAATEVLGYSYPVSGTLYWMFDDESLDERRRRIESAE